MSEAWLRLIGAAPAGFGGWARALENIEFPERIPAEQLAALGFNEAAIERYRKPDEAMLARWVAWLEEPGHGLAVLGTGAYPSILAQIPDAPLALWLDGERPELLDTPALAMVGSRNPTQGGARTATAFGRDLSRAGLTVVSGLAVGIDAASHSGALEGSGSTIAVLGSGIDGIYPRANEALADRIRGNGLLVSEYPPGTAVRRLHFPQRNRIIAGLSLGTLVVEATVRSGSLITARYAAEYAREVMAIPGSIHNPLARGCHRLIRNGAILVEQIADILREIAPQITAPPTDDAPREHVPDAPYIDDPSYAELLNLLDFEPVSIADLEHRSGLTAAELSSMLLLLEMSGAVEALPGARYSRLAERQ